MGKINIEVRPVNHTIETMALQEGYTDLQARILASRLSENSDLPGILKPTFSAIPNPTGMADMEKGVQRIVEAIKNNERIVYICDYDVDGVDSAVVIYRSLYKAFGHTNCEPLIGHRMKDGYGVADTIVDRILAMDVRPTLIMTADCGSSDQLRIKRLKEAGIDVVVTDHHQVPPEGPPIDAYATINPNRLDCPYEEKRICGAAVAYLVMVKVRNELHRQKIKEDLPSLTPLLGYVALATVADCMAIGESPTNRIFIQAGLKIINLGLFPCWIAFMDLIGDDNCPVDTQTLGFQFGPRINARSRMNDPMASFYFLAADNVEEATKYLGELDTDNEARKAVEALMTEEVIKRFNDEKYKDNLTLVTFLEEGHPGVQGIVSSRVTQQYGKPSIILTPTRDYGVVGGSGRSITTINLHGIISEARDGLPEGDVVKFGGHHAACGMSIKREAIPRFIDAIEEAARAHLGDDTELVPCYDVDGAPNTRLGLALVDEINALAPYGFGFPLPIFNQSFVVSDVRLIGKDKNHLKLTLEDGDGHYDAIWFKAVDEEGEPLVKPGDRKLFLFEPGINTYRGQKKFQIRVVDIAD